MYLSFMQMSRVMNLETGLSSILQARFFVSLKRKGQGRRKRILRHRWRKRKKNIIYLEPNIEWKDREFFLLFLKTTLPYLHTWYWTDLAKIITLRIKMKIWIKTFLFSSRVVNHRRRRGIRKWLKWPVIDLNHREGRCWSTFYFLFLKRGIYWKSQDIYL